MRRLDYSHHEFSPAADPALAMLALQAAHPERYPVLLDSAAAGAPLGRFSLLLAAPGERLRLEDTGRLDGPGEGGGFCERLNAWWRETCAAPPAAPWPFAGGWFLFLGYELAQEIEPTLRLPPAPMPLVALAWRMRAAWIHDHASGRSAVLAEPGTEAVVRQLLADIADAPGLDATTPRIGPIVEDDPARYLEACRQTLEHIAAGNVYQANIARAWRTRLPPDTSAAALYARLRSANPGAFAGLAELGECTVLSSSPERLVRVRGRDIDTRPIAGTRPRDPGSDRRSIGELTGSAKERAEHVMLIDLERNDLGRICEPGTVRVDEFMVVESYAHVHHIVSNVCGRLRPEVAPGDVIRALFPGGTITGCPKVRCMQLIGDLERVGRGAYTGAMGYLALDGSLDLNILIRTMTLADGALEWRAGAGIVADSQPERELDETRAKARGLLRSLGSAA